ncbi:hypothetical protein [Exiguobacterium sp. S22-S28]|uniref:hypothetical protein n=1 Tax=Exiguobacterium sp. S22-S28 TaxID=3342768 RepID=UPI00372D656E
MNFYQNQSRIRPLLNVQGEALVQVGDESSSGKACLATRQLPGTLGLKAIKIRNKKRVMFFEN